jgi:hypothetical protein
MKAVTACEITSTEDGVEEEMARRACSRTGGSAVIDSPRVPTVRKARRNLPSINLNIQQYPTQNKLAPMMAAK